MSMKRIMALLIFACGACLFASCQNTTKARLSYGPWEFEVEVLPPSGQPERVSSDQGLLHISASRDQEPDRRGSPKLRLTIHTEEGRR